MPRPRLPIGIQSFEKLRSEGLAYVDKTAYLPKLLAVSSVIFLSRPRRFGKSLLLDMIACAFAGRRELFDGLFLANNWDWSVKHPVLRLDWSLTAPKGAAQTLVALDSAISRWEDEFGAIKIRELPADRMHDLVGHIHRTTGKQVVVLIDEYDKPITDALPWDHSDFSEAIAVRDILRSFYGVFKPLDEHLKFLMLTGVTKWAKAGIFSGLNQLHDVTLDAPFGAICGYTEHDLDSVFGDWLEGLDRTEMRRWYNGYSWLGDSVYNPFDMLEFLQHRRFRAFWFETGTPTALVKLWREKPFDLAKLESLEVGEEILGSFEFQSLAPETLLFQSGYLTIRSSAPSLGGEVFTIGWPNFEVRVSLAKAFLSGGLRDYDAPHELPRQVLRALEAGDPERLRELVSSFFESIPHFWRQERLRRFEAYFASVFYAYFAASGAQVIPEDLSVRGRMDLTVITSRIWIFEFKVRRDGKPVTSPLAQIFERKYAEKYLAEGKPVHRVGIVFDADKREIETWEVG